MYKGKTTQRGWIHLPPVLLRHIVSIFLHDWALERAIPFTWQSRSTGQARHANWLGRTVWTIIRDYQEIERVMKVCPSWERTLETHPFWASAIQTFDPMDYVGSIMQAQTQMQFQNEKAHSAQQLKDVNAWRSTPYKHFRTVLTHICILCLINSPAPPPPPPPPRPESGYPTLPSIGWGYPPSPVSVAPLRKSYNAYCLGYVPICRDHDRAKHKFCGLCLKSAPLNLAYTAYMHHVPSGGPFNHNAMAQAAAHEHEELTLNALGILESPDPELWPGVYTTCKSCRVEWLLSRMRENPADYAALGGDRFNVVDYEIRSVLEGFFDLGEGTVEECIITGRERDWLRRYTRLEDMLSQAVLATRYTTAERDAYQDFEPGLRSFERMLGLEEEVGDDMDLSPSPSPKVQSHAAHSSSHHTSRRQAHSHSDASSILSDPSSVEELDSEEEDADFLAMTESDGVRDLALNDWARTRILEGFWISPADQFYRAPAPPTRVAHPAPWTLETDSRDDEEEDAHPRKDILLQSPPPTYPLCEQAYQAHRRSLSQILLPAMKNIVRRLVMECGEDGTDPAVRASKMQLEDVRREISREESWVEGVDWVQRKREREEERERERQLEIEKEDSNSSNSGSASTGSNATSPVLSTTTLGTTPSPPPPTDESEKENSSQTTATPQEPRRITIPITPVLNPPRLISTIPYVPVTLEHMPMYSIEAFKSVWREACAPLYHCRCTICERAMKAAALAAAQSNSSSVSTRPPRIDTTSSSGGQPNATNSPIVPSPTSYQDVREIRIGGDDDDPEASPPVVEIKLSPRPEDDDDDDVRRSWERTPSPQQTRKRSVDELEGEEASLYEEEEEEDQRTPPRRVVRTTRRSSSTVSADARKELIIRIAPRRAAAAATPDYGGIRFHSPSPHSTPSKRQRIADPARTEMLNRKRSSEELDFDSSGENQKRRKYTAAKAMSEGDDSGDESPS